MKHGTAFQLVINGEPVFVKGLNWLPGDSFPARMVREDYASLLRKSVEANANLLRVWGGDYEFDEFYFMLDELGLLVWQDFPLACAAYAEEEPILGESSPRRGKTLRDERTPQPCALERWEREHLGLRGLGLEGVSGRVAPGLGGTTRRSSPASSPNSTRHGPYSPGSPYSFRPGIHPNDPAHGSMHIWDVWNRRTTPTTRRTHRGSSPSSGSRDRRRGRL